MSESIDFHLSKSFQICAETVSADSEEKKRAGVSNERSPKQSSIFDHQILKEKSNLKTEQTREMLAKMLKKPERLEACNYVEKISSLAQRFEKFQNSDFETLRNYLQEFSYQSFEENNMKVDKLFCVSNIGDGAESYTLKLEDFSTKKAYALRIAKKRSQLDVLKKSDFKKELLCLLKIINLKNMVKIFLIGFFDELYCVMMECGLGTLSSFIKYLDEKKLALTSMNQEDVNYKCNKQLENLHSENIYHRDIKPDNIIITEDWDFKFIDFGFSQLSEYSQGIFSFCGTPGYMNEVLCEAHNKKYSKLKLDLKDADQFAFQKSMEKLRHIEASVISENLGPLLRFNSGFKEYTYKIYAGRLIESQNKNHLKSHIKAYEATEKYKEILSSIEIQLQHLECRRKSESKKNTKFTLWVEFYDICCNKAETLINDDNTDEAFVLIKKTLSELEDPKFFEKNEDKNFNLPEEFCEFFDTNMILLYLKLRLNFKLSKCFMEIEDYSQSIIILTRLFEQYSSYEFFRLMWDTTRFTYLAKCYSMLNMPQKSLEFNKKGIENQLKIQREEDVTNVENTTFRKSDLSLIQSYLINADNYCEMEDIESCEKEFKKIEDLSGPFIE